MSKIQGEKNKIFRFYVGQHTYLIEINETDIEKAMKYACKYFGIYDVTILKETKTQITFNGFTGIDGHDKQELKYKIIGKE